ncbi:MAG: 3-phosphoshikimate 1-carboxyvinyltransferase [Spirochaetota bacterium]
MDRIIQPATISGSLTVPASKSQTIRALLIATAAEGQSTIGNPLSSQDTLACVEACRAMGAEIEMDRDPWRVTGTGLPAAAYQEKTPQPLFIDVKNSGTTLYLGTGIAAALGVPVVFTGDEQIRNRPAAPLLSSYQDLGARISWEPQTAGEVAPEAKEGCPPFLIHGPLLGGRTTISCPTSQYLSSLLLAAPLAGGESHITVPLLYERPYVEMTIQWLEEQHIVLHRRTDPVDEFFIPGNQGYRPFDKRISGDFSSASFFLCAAAVTGSSITLLGLDQNDVQGDKDILTCLEQMGCTVQWNGSSVTLSAPAGGLTGDVSLDLNAIPDTLPALAVTACFCQGTVRLENVPQARIKETDRIAVMCSELQKLGADIRELEDGLEIHGTGTLSGGTVTGHEDHRVIMACAVAALGCETPVTIEGTGAVDITCPDFFTLLAEVTCDR